jgi:hypothetical protein
MGRPLKISPTAQWLPTEKAAIELGTSDEMLQRHRRKGYLKLGVHYRIVSPPGQRIRCAWNVTALGELFATLPEFRPILEVPVNGDAPGGSSRD